MNSQQIVFAAVALFAILLVGLKWPSATVWILVLIIVAALIARWEHVKAAIYGG